MKKKSHLIIDAYNVMHCWEEFRSLLDHHLGAARERFINNVRVIYDVEGLQTTIVFDGKGAKIEQQDEYSEEGFCCLFAPSDLTADAVIERIVMRSKTPIQLTVVTRDNMIGESIRASGGMVISPDDLRAWVERCSLRQSHQIKSHTDENARRLSRQSEDDGINDPWSQL